MKRFPSILSLIVVLTFALHVSSQSNVDECRSIYEVVSANVNSKEVPKLEQAAASGKAFLTQCKELTTDGWDKIFKWVSEEMPVLENRIGALKVEIIFNNAIAKRNYDEMIAAAKQLIERKPTQALDFTLDIASIGFDNASAKPPVDKYNADAIKFANLALKKLADGDTSGNKDKYGIYAPYKNEKCADGKTNAIGFMNYTIGYIMFAREKKTKDALPYLYAASQTGCETKEFSDGYRFIGSWYVDEAIKIGQRRTELLKAAGDKETPETQAMFELQMGYVDRAIDALARAARISNTNPKASQSYKDLLQERLKELFVARFDGDTSKISEVVSKALDTPFPNPSTPVTPVKLTTPQ